MEMKLRLTEELRPFKHSHFRQLLHDRVWTYPHTDRFQTLHTLCKHIEVLHLEFHCHLLNLVILGSFLAL